MLDTKVSPVAWASVGAASRTFTFRISRVLKASRTAETARSVTPSFPTWKIGFNGWASDLRWARWPGVRESMTILPVRVQWVARAR